MASKHQSYENFHDPIRIALEYGFTPIKRMHISEEKRKLGDAIDVKETHEVETSIKYLDVDTKEKIGLVNAAIEAGANGGQPCATYYEKELKNGLLCHFDIVGNGNGVAEGLVIASCIALLTDIGVEEPTVSINCMGDKDSFERFKRALTEYYKKNIDALPQSCKTAIKKDIFAILSCSHEKCKALAEERPKASISSANKAATISKRCLNTSRRQR